LRFVRCHLPLSDRLAIPPGRGTFTVAQYTSAGLILLVGEKEARTPLPGRALEELPDFLRGRGWVPIGSRYSTDSMAGSMDEYLKRYLKRATAGWVAERHHQEGHELGRGPDTHYRLLRDVRALPWLQPAGRLRHFRHHNGHRRARALHHLQTQGPAVKTELGPTPTSATAGRFRHMRAWGEICQKASHVAPLAHRALPASPSSWLLGCSRWRWAGRRAERAALT
jgi:hypothetical protein